MTFKTLAFGCASATVWALGGVAMAESTVGASTSATATASAVVVTARRLDQARDTIQPQTGASTYVINAKAIQSMPGGDNAQLNQVVLQAPGVAQDSYGQLHIRGEHNGLQYRLNGVILPEGLTVFGQALSPRLADRVTLITGALPAQYGLRTAGIVDITTKSGIQQGGSVSIYGGSHGEIEPSFEYAGHVGDTNLFVSGSFLTDKLGIESPDGRSTPLHDRTDQSQGFAYLDRVIDPASRVSLVVGVSSDRFQIPDSAGISTIPGYSVGGQTSYASSQLNENQTESTEYGALSYLRSTERLTTQVSLFARYSQLKFSPDEVGDLLFNGISQFADKADTAGGLQAEGSYHLNDFHTLRGGIIVEVDRSNSQTTSQAFLVGDPPPFPVTMIIDNGAKTAESYSGYLQDEWKLLTNLTLNYGLRFDQFDGYRDENQLSPRVNLVWQAPWGSTFHAGYSRYFSPPPFELVGGETLSKFASTSAAPTFPKDTTPYSERANYYDVGVVKKFTRALSAGIDTYYKTSTQLIDEGQFGAPIIETPFNYKNGRQYGVELTTNYNAGPLSAYANFAYSAAQGEDIDSSEFNFTAPELAYIKNHYIYLDHNQTYSASFGASYLWQGSRLSTDLIYGSGLRADLPLTTSIPTSAGLLDAIPNGKALDPYIQVNLSASHRFETAPGGPYEARLDLINVLDDKYEIRDGTGVGVGAPQFGPRRGVFAGLTKEF